MDKTDRIRKDAMCPHVNHIIMCEDTKFTRKNLSILNAEENVVCFSKIYFDTEQKKILCSYGNILMLRMSKCLFSQVIIC